jgi:hypothetical protein
MSISRFAMEIVVALAICIAGAIVVVGAMEFGIRWSESGPEAGYFPFYVGLLLIFGGIGAGAQAVFTRPDSVFLDRMQLQRLVSFFVPMLIFVIISVFLGLYVGTAVYLLVVMRFQGGYRWPFSLVVSIGTVLFFFVIFEVWFQVPLLKGPLEEFLGIY